MTELVERYVHQVGRYLPQKERAEIEAELRSQIQDQLDDRYGASPSAEDVASVLAEFGHPYQMATFYSSDKYLVGPVLYPYMMMVLRQGWLIVPSIVVFLSIFGALIAAQQSSLFNLLMDTVITALQATLIFSAVIILFFALIQHSYLKIDADAVVFNPLTLPEVDDPRTVDRLESTVGIAIATFVTLVFLYFLRVGGLTLNNPSDVIPVPISWLILFIITVIGMMILHLLVLRRDRWGVGSWLIETVLELIGSVCLYFVLYQPLYARLITAVPALTDVPLPEILVVIGAIGTLVRRGSRLVKLWNY